MDRQVLSVVVAPMMKDLALTKTQMGWIQNFFLLSIGFLSIPIAYLVDRWSRTKAMGIMTIVWSAATFVTGLGKGFISVLLPRLVVGVGEAGFGPGGTALIAASYKPEERGHKLSIFNMFIGLGIVAGLLLGGFIAQAWGWAAPFFVFAIPGIILAIIAFSMQDYPTTPKAETRDTLIRNCVQLWKIPTLRWLYIGYGMYCTMFFAVTHWNIAALMFKFKLSVAQAPIIMSAAIIIALPANPLWGRFSDKLEQRRPGGRMRTSAWCCFGTSIAAIVYFILTFFIYDGAFGDWGAVLIIGLVFYLIHVCMANGVGGTIAASTQAVVPVNLKSLSFGMAMTSLYVLGGGWGSGIASMLADALGTGKPGDWRGIVYGLMVTCIFGVLGTLCWLRSAHHYKTDIQKVQSVADPIIIAKAR
ncbi:MAG: MFS transporter [Syntrophobacteraceae bacterium]